MKKSVIYVFLIIVNCMIVSQTNAAVVKIQLKATDLYGAPLTSIVMGENFMMQTWVEDLRDDAQGVFAAYVDVEYDPSKVSLTGPINHGVDFDNIQSGSIMTPGIIDEVGGVSSGSILGGGEFLLFSIVCQADMTGTTTLFVQGADNLPSHEVLVYGMDEPVSITDIDFMSASVVISNVPLPGSFSFFSTGLVSLFYIVRRSAG